VDISKMNLKKTEKIEDIYIIGEIIGHSSGAKARYVTHKKTKI
jgi:hypothetical protein